MKVVVLTNMLPPYRIPFFRNLARSCGLTVVVDKVMENGRMWKHEVSDLGFELEILDGASMNLRRVRSDVKYKEVRPFHFSLGVIATLRKLKPDVIVTLELGFRTLWALMYARLFGCKIILWTEGTMHTEGHVGWIKQLIRRFLVRRMDGFWTNGPESTGLICSYGGIHDLATESMTGIDTSWWLENVQSLRKEQDEIRAEIGISGLAVIVNGSLSPRKGTRQLLDALDLWNPGEPTTLIFLGTGESEPALRAWADNQRDFKVIVTGFLEPTEMPRYFAAADWAILPTLDDNWPLATLEVLCGSLPQLFSIYNGATVDLCQDGVTGHVFDPLDIDSFVQALERMEREGARRIPAAVVSEYVSRYSPQAQAGRAIASLHKVVSC